MLGTQSISQYIYIYIYYIEHTYYLLLADSVLYNSILSALYYILCTMTVYYILLTTVCLLYILCILYTLHYIRFTIYDMPNAGLGTIDCILSALQDVTDTTYYHYVLSSMYYIQHICLYTYTYIYMHTYLYTVYDARYTVTNNHYVLYST